MNSSGENNASTAPETQQPASQKSPAKLYRGGVEALKNINDPGFDLSSLVEKVPGFLDEPDKFIFRVRAQMAWFRSIYPHGYVIPEIVTNSEVEVLVKASVYAGEGQFLQSAHASANVARDSAGGFPLVETAESRAIARALDYAGFGCQLDIKTYEESDSKEETDPESPAKEALESNREPTPEPEKIDGRLKVPANDNPDAPKADDDKKGRKRGKNSPVGNPVEDQSSGSGKAHDDTLDTETPGQGTTDPTHFDLAGEQGPPVAAAATNNDGVTAAASEERNELDNNTPPTNPLSEPKNPATETGDLAAGTGDDQKGVASGDVQAPYAPASSIVVNHEGKTADEVVAEYVGLTSESGCKTFDPRFFNKINTTKEGIQNVRSDESVDSDAYYINASGVETRVRNKDLQHALEYLGTHTELQNQILFPGVPTSPLRGKTFGEVIDTERGRENIYSCSRKYMKDNVPAYAAALLVGYTINHPSDQSADPAQAGEFVS